MSQKEKNKKISGAKRKRQNKQINLAGLARPFLALVFLLLLIPPFYLSFKKSGAFAQDIQEKIYQKQRELESVEKQIQSLDASIKKKEGEIKSVEKQLEALEENISKVKLEIHKTSLEAQETSLEIEKIQEEISVKESIIEYQKKVIKEYLRIMYESDAESFLEILFSGEKFSESWNDIEAIQNVQSEIQEALANLKNQKTILGEKEEILLKKQEEQNALLEMQNAQKESLNFSQIQKETFLKKSQNKKEELESSIASSESRKRILREEIFQLKSSGVSMTMQKALETARYAAARTGIRPEFLLGLLKVESDLGNNVGSGNYKTDMNPAQYEAFFSITKKLGMNPETAPVSKRPTNYKGWGGAMGPAQMMPKTWLGYETDVARLTEHNPPSPWNNEDAFTAAALKLSRDGASSQKKEDEWKAAMLYLAGSNWNNPKLAWYGNRVLELAEVYGS